MTAPSGALVVPTDAAIQAAAGLNGKIIAANNVSQPTRQGTSFETITGATGLLALTKQITVFGTVHVPLFHPASAAKQMVTAGHVGHGRFGLNIDAGWNEEEFAMFGSIRNAGARYEEAQPACACRRSIMRPEGWCRPSIMRARMSTKSAPNLRRSDARWPIGTDRSADEDQQPHATMLAKPASTASASRSLTTSANCRRSLA